MKKPQTKKNKRDIRSEPLLNQIVDMSVEVLIAGMEGFDAAGMTVTFERVDEATVHFEMHDSRSSGAQVYGVLQAWAGGMMTNVQVFKDSPPINRRHLGLFVGVMLGFGLALVLPIIQILSNLFSMMRELSVGLGFFVLLALILVLVAIGILTRIGLTLWGFIALSADNREGYQKLVDAMTQLISETEA